MQNKILLSALVALLILSGCQSKPVCPMSTEPRQYLTLEDIQTQPALSTPSPTSPVEMKINGTRVTVDKIVTGPLCNDTWQGTVYVGCDVQVLEWEEEPLFLKDCRLSIAEGTVVYVAYHNNAAYFNGCSCHTGEVPAPK
jgi:hypothetical protein